MFWFHCGRCGALFQSEPGESEGRLCPKCGHDPCPGIQAPTAETLPDPREGSPETTEENTPARHERQKVKRRTNRHLMLKIFGGWSILLALIFFTVRQFYGGKPADRLAASETEMNASVDSQEDQHLLEKHLQDCASILTGFLSQTAPEQCSEFVLNPTETVGRMVRYQGYNSLPKVDPQSLSMREQSVIHFTDGKGIEIRWLTKDGLQLESAFREEQGEWRLDWEQYARFSDYSWSLFLAGSGPGEGEFRLLARERLVEERKDKDKTISVVFYTPRFGQPLEAGFQSPEFLIPRDSPSGRNIEAGFRAASAGKQPFGNPLPNPNPDGLIRVRVKVKRSEVNMERRFEVIDVPACHWYSSNELGVDPTPVSADKPDSQ